MTWRAMYKISEAVAGMAGVYYGTVRDEYAFATYCLALSLLFRNFARDENA